MAFKQVTQVLSVVPSGVANIGECECAIVNNWLRLVNPVSALTPFQCSLQSKPMSAYTKDTQVTLFETATGFKYTITAINNWSTDSDGTWATCCHDIWLGSTRALHMDVNTYYVVANPHGTRYNSVNSFPIVFYRDTDQKYFATIGSLGGENDLSNREFPTNFIDVTTYFQGQEYNYHWTAWNLIAGNSGQFRMNLTKVKNAALVGVDPSGYKVLTASDFDAITGESSVWNTYLNALLNYEYTIAYSGNNKATLTISNHATDPGIKIFTFKFYFAGVDAPFATIPIEVITGGDNQALINHDYYMSFICDTNEQVAVFYPIGYTPNNSLITYYHQVGSALSSTTMSNLYIWLNASSGTPSGTGPYDTGTTSTGGTPTGGGHQDPMPTAHVPTLSGASSGMFTIYCPDETELGQIADFLWSDAVLDNFKKYFNNFSDNLIALYVLPYKPANLPTKAFTVGKLTSQTITAIEYVTTRFVSIPMGELEVGTRWDSYLDFDPYTKFNIYLPGIGVQSLAADDIMCQPNMDESLPAAKGSKLSIEYVLDLMTGNVAAYIKINGQIRYQFTGKVGYNIPITGSNYNSMVQGYVMATAGLIGTLATAGAAAPFAASAGAAGIINAMKPDVYRGGNLSGDSSALCLQYPYLIRRRPNKPQLTDQESFTGFPSYKDGLLSEFSGYTEVIQAHVEGISCTESERVEILRLLKEGVII